MTTPSSPGKATTSRGCWRAQREGEFLQVLQMPAGASPGTCREVRVTMALFCSLGITVKPKESFRKRYCQTKRCTGTFVHIKS